jgi:hypothetical protein
MQFAEKNEQGLYDNEGERTSEEVKKGEELKREKEKEEERRKGYCIFWVLLQLTYLVSFDIKRIPSTIVLGGVNHNETLTKSRLEFLES